MKCHNGSVGRVAGLWTGVQATGTKWDLIKLLVKKKKKKEREHSIQTTQWSHKKVKTLWPHQDEKWFSSHSATWLDDFRLNYIVSAVPLIRFPAP